MRVIKTKQEKSTVPFCVDNITFEDKNGKGFDRYRITSNDVVHIIPYDPKTQLIYLIQEFRVGAMKNVFQFPAGKIDAGETPEEAATRELKEEIGVEGKLTPLTKGFSSCGLMSEKSYLFFCEVTRELTDEEKKEFPLDENEAMTTVKVTPQVLKELYQNGGIECLKSQLLIFLFREKLHQEQPESSS